VCRYKSNIAQGVVVADLKSPKEWKCGSFKYIETHEQFTQLNYDTIHYLPNNSYTRKNIGYLYAIQHNAEVIFDTDDDNYINGVAVDMVRENVYSDYVSSLSSVTIFYTIKYAF
jgi:hypothetical protein